jgi:hypothetical protein
VSGRAGTVFYDIQVPNFTQESLAMSGLLLSAVPTQGSADVFTPQRDPAAEKLLGAPPTSRREFDRTEVLAWLTEIYDNARQAKQFDVATRLIDANGRDAFASREMLTNGESGSSKWTAFAYTGRIPLKEIAAGRYLMRIEASDRADADPSRTVVAQTLITVTP